MKENDGKNDSTAAPDTLPAKRPLFRSEAVNYARIQTHGAVLLTTRLSHRYLTALIAIIAMAIIAFLFTFNTIRKAPCYGIAVPRGGMVRIAAVTSGTVVKKNVSDGQFVNSGDVLFVLSAERSSTNVHSAERAFASLLHNQRLSLQAEFLHAQRQSQLRSAAFHRRAHELEGEISHIVGQVALQFERVAIAEESSKRFETLRQTNFISDAHSKEKQVELLEQRQRLVEFQKLLNGKKMELVIAKGELEESRIQTLRELEAINRNVLAIELQLTESDARREIVIRAPQSGIIAALMVAPGQTVFPQTTLASIVPDGSPLEIELYAPSRSIGFIKPGMNVSLRIQAYPYQKFGQHAGTVVNISNASISPEEAPSLGPVSAEPLYRIRVRPHRAWISAYGKKLPIKPGMLVEASVFLDERRLYEWILDPLISVTGKK